jgi:PAS domain S-box-containing protein
MGADKPSYEELEARLAEAEKTLKAIRNEKIDAVIGQKGPYLLRLKELEEALRNSEENFRLAAKAARVGAYSHNLQTGEDFWSPEFLAIYGLGPDQALPLKNRIPAAVHPEDRQRVLAEARARLNRTFAPEFSSEHRIIMPDGEIRWVMIRGRMVFDAQGRPMRTHGIVMDITEHKRAGETVSKAVETSKALNRVSEALHSTLDFDEVMQRIVVEGSALLGSESAAVSLRRGGGWIVSHMYGMPASLVGTRMEDDQEQHAVLAFESRRPVAVADAFNDDRFDREHFRCYKIRSVLVSPLIARNEVLGVIFFNYHSARHDFTVAELDFSFQMATIAGAALANAQLFKERKAAEDEVRKINLDLEQRVKDRTAEIEAQYKELTELNEIIRRLSNKTIEAMESDRKTLSKEIHDSIAGALAAIKMQLEIRMSRMNPSAQDLPSDIMTFEEIVAHLIEVIKETRRISWQLRSRTLDDFGLKSALAENIRHFNQFYPGIEVVSQFEIADESIPPDIQTVLYRVAQEALNNAGRHSRATQVRVKLTNHQNQICLEVEDNGCGFDLKKTLSETVSLTGYGVHSMRERVEICKGKFQIRSEPGNGTAIDVFIPI